MANPVFSTNFNVWLEESDTATITRRNETGETFAVSTIYSGAANFDPSGGSIFYDPSGTVDKADAVLIVDPVNGVLPAININDIVVITGVAGQYNVAMVQPWTFPPIHLELQLKRGPIQYSGAKV